MYFTKKELVKPFIVYHQNDEDDDSDDDKNTDNNSNSDANHLFGTWYRKKHQTKCSEQSQLHKFTSTVQRHKRIFNTLARGKQTSQLSICVDVIMRCIFYEVCQILELCTK